LRTQKLITTSHLEKPRWFYFAQKPFKEAIAMLDKQTLKVEEAAKLLGISRAAAYNLAAKGELPGARRLGRRYVVLKDVLQRFLQGESQAR
jgi:excisionase family DNA binding protein